MLARVLSSNRVLFRGVVFGALLGTTMGLAAVAQPGGGGGIPPEQRAAIEAAQAGAVAADLQLDAEKTAKLVTANAAFQKEAAANRPQGGGRGDFEAMRKQQEARRAALAGELQSFLDEAQAKQAADVLAGFNRGWDRYVAVILGFGLEEAKQSEALGHTLAYVKAGAKAMGGASADSDFQGIRTAMTDAKKTLDESIAPLLSDEQKAEWTTKTERGSRGGGAGGGGAGGQRRDRGGDNS